MDSNSLIALASILSGVGAAAAAIVAAYALRAQQRTQQRQHDLENLRWLTDQYHGLRPLRRRAAAGLLEGTADLDALRDVLNFFENSGYLVREGFITERLFSMLGELAVLGWWYAAQDFINDSRRRIDPRVFDEFEALKDRLLPAAGFEPDAAYVAGFLRREASGAVRTAREDA